MNGTNKQGKWETKFLDSLRLKPNMWKQSAKIHMEFSPQV
jgi:hypothetical protein